MRGRKKPLNAEKKYYFIGIIIIHNISLYAYIIIWRYGIEAALYNSNLLYRRRHANGGYLGGSLSRSKSPAHYRLLLSLSHTRAGQHSSYIYCTHIYNIYQTRQVGSRYRYIYIYINNHVWLNSLMKFKVIVVVVAFKRRFITFAIVYTTYIYIYGTCTRTRTNIYIYILVRILCRLECR